MALSISKRLTLMSAAPVILLSITLFVLTLFESEQLRQQQLELTQAKFLESKQEQLEFMNRMAYSAISHIYEKGGSLEEALPILRNLKFGDNGYFFGYSGTGDRVFLGRLEKGIGKNFWDLQDSKGVYLIRELVKAGKDGGGIVSYYFPKPNQQIAEEKLSYAFYLDRWDLMIGAGFYLDDVDAVINQLEQDSAESQAELLLYFGIVSAVLLVLVVIFSSLVRRSVMLPLQRLSASMKELVSGDLSAI